MLHHLVTAVKSHSITITAASSSRGSSSSSSSSSEIVYTITCLSVSPIHCELQQSPHDNRVAGSVDDVQLVHAVRLRARELRRDLREREQPGETCESDPQSEPMLKIQ